MKTRNNLSTIARLLASILAVGGFIWMVGGSYPEGPENPQNKMTESKKQLPDGQIEETYTWTTEDGKPAGKGTMTGMLDKKGNRQGWTELVTYNPDGKAMQIGAGDYVDGFQTGQWTYITSNPYSIRTEWWLMGKCFGSGSNSEVAPLKTSHTSAFDIIKKTFFLYQESLKLFSISDSILREYTDSLEVILNRQEFDRDSFSIYYDEAAAELGLSPKMDTISGVINLLIAPDALYKIKRYEFRLAVLDRSYLTEPVSTFSIITTSYPGYLRCMNLYGITGEDLEAFCQDHDSVMDSYPPLNREDPFFVDSIDFRMYRAIIETIDSSATFSVLQEVKELVNNGQINEARYKAGKVLVRLKSSSYSPELIMFIMMIDLQQQALEADFVRNAVKEAYYLNHNWPQLPIVITEYYGNNSATSVTIRGNVLRSQGADVTERGIAWAESYNPSEYDNVIKAENGTGIFFVSIDGLDPEKTYNARSYATNSEGTVYGNNIEFTTSRVSSVELPQIPAQEVILFPNPVSQVATLSYSVTLPDTYKISILDMNGREVYVIETKHQATGSYLTRLDLSAVPSGIYFCRITNGRNITALKILVAK